MEIKNGDDVIRTIFLLLGLCFAIFVIPKYFNPPSSVKDDAQELNVFEGHDQIRPNNQSDDSGSNPSQDVPEPTTYQNAIKAAKILNKPLLLIFSSDWCTPCQAMKRNTWSNARVKQKMESYVVYHVNIDEEQQVRRDHSVDSVPTYIALDVSNDTFRELKRGVGNRGPDEIIRWLDSVLN